MSRKIFDESSGNVFLDMGFRPVEAQHLLLRAELMVQLRRIVKNRKLTQLKAAKLFKVTQPRVSDLLRGKIDRFSIDGLIAMLGHAGMSISFKIKAAA